jgi:superfamily II RNA helicase
MASSSTVYLDVVPNDRVVETINPAITFSYPLDSFQKQAQYYIQKDELVLVTAHTSAGKTTVAEAAIAYAKREGQRIFYTSPIKTLSNQKYSEFLKKFSDVGLLTGDIKCNPDAQCVIMTTEILRDMLYKESHAEAIKTLGCVIFDEIHYINNPDRGHVWEECIVKLPPSVNIVGLSATISESEKFAEWMGQLKKKPIHLISTLKRPVPLNHYAFTNNELHLILDNHGHFHDQNYSAYTQEFKQLERKGHFNSINLLNPFIAYLKKHLLNPAIFFTFSRKKCEQFAQTVNIALVDQKEQALIANEVNYYLAKHTTPKETLEKMPQVGFMRGLLARGVGVHHSGLLPVLKEIVEILFGKGLIKVLFATETFSVGVNLPCKCVVFTELTKHCDGNEHPRLLKPDEYLQMSGRAGRRGMDKFGTVVHLPLSGIQDQSEIRGLLLGKSGRIESKFKINSAFLLQMLAQTKSSDGQNQLAIEDSYMARQYGETIGYLKVDHKVLEDKIKVIDQQLSTYDAHTQERLQKLVDLEAKAASPMELHGLSVKLNKGQQKKLTAEIAELKQQLMAVPQADDMIKDVKNNLDERNHYEQTMTDQYHQCVQELTQLGFLTTEPNQKSTDLTRQNLTEKGVIASQVITSNEILMAELLTSGKLDELDVPSLASVLSLFCDDSSRVSDSNKKCVIPQIACDVIDWIYYLSEDLSAQSEVYRTAFEERGLDDSLTNVTYLWAEGRTYFEVLPYMEGYEGNFIRSMLRLSHIADELIKVCEVMQNATLEKKLLNLKEKVVRDIVTSDSLYLRM